VAERSQIRPTAASTTTIVNMLKANGRGEKRFEVTSSRTTSSSGKNRPSFNSLKRGVIDLMIHVRRSDLRPIGLAAGSAPRTSAISFQASRQADQGCSDGRRRQSRISRKALAHGPPNIRSISWAYNFAFATAWRTKKAGGKGLRISPGSAAQGDVGPIRVMYRLSCGTDGCGWTRGVRAEIYTGVAGRGSASTGSRA